MNLLGLEKNETERSFSILCLFVTKFSQPFGSATTWARKSQSEVSEDRSNTWQREAASWSDEDAHTAMCTSHHTAVTHAQPEFYWSRWILHWKWWLVLTLNVNKVVRKNINGRNSGMWINGSIFQMQKLHLRVMWSYFITVNVFQVL